MTATDFITVDEAARRLGVSIATARRMASSGKVSAIKTGRQWLVDGSTLPPTFRKRRLAAGAPSLDFECALQHVKTTDLVQAWVPDVLRYEDALAQPGRLLAQAAEIIANSNPGPAEEVEVDKTLIFTRPGTLLSLPDRIAYQAIVGSFATRIEGETPDSVFSARLSDEPQAFLKPGAEQWVLWRRSVLQQLDDTSPWLVESDLTAHFDTVSLDPLMAELAALNVDPGLLEVLGIMLEAWQPIPGTGLPQGPNASRLLANVHLLPVDRAMLRSGFGYSRFMDDVRIVASSRIEAVEAVRTFQRECRSRGLIVSSSKTQLLHGEEAKRSLKDSDDLALIEYLMDHGSIRMSRRRLQSVLRKAIAKRLHIDDRRVRFSLWRLAKLRDNATLGLVLSHLEDLGPHAQIVARYLRPFITRPRVVRELGAFLADDDRARSRYLVAWLFAAMLEHPSPIPEQWGHEARRRAFDRNQPSYLRALAAVVAVRAGEAADVARIRAEIPREYEPTILRAYTVALFVAGELTDDIRRHLRRRQDLHTTIDYLDGRESLPSLVHWETDASLL